MARRWHIETHRRLLLALAIIVGLAAYIGLQSGPRELMNETDDLFREWPRSTVEGPK